MSDDTENEVEEGASAGDIVTAFARFAGHVVGYLLFVVAGVGVVLGAGLATGRAADILQGAVSRPGLGLEGMFDGWAILIGSYLVVWLPVSVLLREMRREDPG